MRTLLERAGLNEREEVAVKVQIQHQKGKMVDIPSDRKAVESGYKKLERYFRRVDDKALRPD